MEVRSLTEDRTMVIEKMDKLLQSWDGTADSGPVIIEKMKYLLDELQQIQENKGDSIPYSTEEATLLTQIYRTEKLLLFAMRNRKEYLAKEMMGMNKKETLVQNYLYPRKAPVFVNQHL
ncbi:hypothetical protein [Jeotgalibaca caeni]|uniref:hypothetical protein n=1 Tax=Jeotgalibaca caeni TaxID=3028623 RepID=UPI00237EE4CD|nr:hypothetical protein [Jeotgalibaca caeni]MDE1548290.1 hypothetical protein [Jeotgalibaca caeni]